MIDLKQTALGIELGSTRVKAVLTDSRGKMLASGSVRWKSVIENGLFTYSLDYVWETVAKCYAELKKDFYAKYGEIITEVGKMGVSAMMHGYLAFDADWNLLTPFRTWRNTNACSAAEVLTEKLGYPIPSRWSCAHLYQAVLNREQHLEKLSNLTTLSGYVHYMLTGVNVLGIGDASGMFPVGKKGFRKDLAELFDSETKRLGCKIKLFNVLPKVASAGEFAGFLTKNGAKLLDAEGDLKAGAEMCPPEGDAATGMVSTNSVKKSTGNISAGTSIFGMITLEHELTEFVRGIDIVATPTGDPVAMVHCNNCTSELDGWIDLFEEYNELTGFKAERGNLYEMLFRHSLTGSEDCGGLVEINYLSGEPTESINCGTPLFMRDRQSSFNLANFMRCQLYSCFVTLKLGMEKLFSSGMKAEKMYAQGGLFKTGGVCQGYLASAIRCPVVLAENADNGGAWGMAVLAGYLGSKMPLEDYLSEIIFSDSCESTVYPDETSARGFDEYALKFKSFLDLERLAEEKTGGK